MKALKITLALLTLCILGWVGYSLFIKKPDKIIIPVAPDTFVQEINLKIDKLSKSPISEFCVKNYTTLKNDIVFYAKEGKINNAWEITLLESLEFTYTKVFVGQAYFLFNGKAWEIEKLDTIRTEVDKLLSSKYIVTKTDLINIKNIIKQYLEISSFISSARSFANDINITSISQQFDLINSQEYIKKSKEYHDLKSYTNNCTRIQNQLESIPNSMYLKHLNYLTKKVNYSVGKYRALPSYITYYNTIYQPIYSEFKLFEDNYSTYSVEFSELEDDLLSLKDQIKKDGQAANSFKFSNK
jgi:hypothetical protein